MIAILVAALDPKGALVGAGDEVESAGFGAPKVKASLLDVDASVAALLAEPELPKTNPTGLPKLPFDPKTKGELELPAFVVVVVVVVVLVLLPKTLSAAADELLLVSAVGLLPKRVLLVDPNTLIGLLEVEAGIPNGEGVLEADAKGDGFEAVFTKSNGLDFVSELLPDPEKRDEDAAGLSADAAPNADLGAGADASPKVGLNPPPNGEGVVGVIPKEGLNPPPNGALDAGLDAGLLAPPKGCDEEEIALKSGLKPPLRGLIGFVLASGAGSNVLISCVIADFVFEKKGLVDPFILVSGLAFCSVENSF